MRGKTASKNIIAKVPTILLMNDFIFYTEKADEKQLLILLKKMQHLNSSMVTILIKY